MKLFLLLIMIFVHIIDDFHFQGILANLKQKSFWKKQIQELSSTAYIFNEQVPNTTEAFTEFITKNDSYLSKLYKNDWLISLVIHAFQWTFLVMSVLVFYKINLIQDPVFYVMFILNLLIHATVDHFKCNKFYISLLTDQLIHLFQIVFTWLILGVL